MHFLRARAAFSLVLLIVVAACDNNAPTREPAQTAVFPAPIASSPPILPSGTSDALHDLKVLAVGTMVGSDPARDLALLSLNRGPAFEVTRETQLAPGIRVLEISSTQVVLASGEHRRVLPIEGPGAIGAAAAKPIHAGAPESSFIGDVFLKALQELPPANSKQ